MSGKLVSYEYFTKYVVRRQKFHVCVLLRQKVATHVAQEFFGLSIATQDDQSS
jgi:hypothetical protein